MTVLITGGSGFIGANITRRLLNDGWDVRVLDDLSNGYRDNLEGVDVDFREASFLDAEALASAMKGVDRVVHLGALGSVPRSIDNPGRTHEVNATGTLRVLEAARDADGAHVICASSSSVYGMNPALPKHEREWVRPMSPYAVSKLATEQYTLAFQQSFGLDTLAFRFFNVYGPWQRPGHVYAAVIPIFMDHAIDGKPLPVNGDGTQSRDFTYVGTLCEVLAQAVERKVSHPEPVNLAFGTNTQVLEVADKVAAACDTTVEFDFRPPRRGDVPHSQADNASLRSLFPTVEPVPMDEGIAETRRWFAEELGR